MLRYLTHKLRTQSLNETETYHVKTDDDRDSGTESDDEGAEIEELQKYMESIIHLDSHHSDPRQRGRRPQQQQPSSQNYQVTTPAPEEEESHNHHHHRQHHRPRRRLPPRRPSPPDSALPSDSEAQHEAHSSEEELEGINSGGPPPPPVEKRKWGAGDPPVQFRTSPPAHACRPGGPLLRAGAIPPHELWCSASPRKRHRRTPTAVQQRPCLDFEKMQQINRVRLL